MIIIWDTGLPSSTMARYAHLWKKMGRGHAEEVIVLPYSRQRRDEELRKVNTYNRRHVIFVKPQFIPSPAFYEELYFLREQEQLIIVPHTFTGVFEYNTDYPTEWKVNSISDAFIITQLSGQTRVTLPNKNIWEWMKKTNHGGVYKIMSRFTGSREIGAAMRNTLGEIILDPFGKADRISFGKVITGGDKWYTREKQNKMWQEAITGWELWEEKR